MKIFYLMAGGALGSLARYYMGGFAHKVVPGVFPWGTLAVNVAGSFIIGLLWGLFEMKNISPHMRMFIFVGFLGGFTTFSTFALETMNLAREGNIKFAIINVLVNNFLAILFVFIGFFLAKAMLTTIKS